MTRGAGGGSRKAAWSGGQCGEEARKLGMGRVTLHSLYCRRSLSRAPGTRRPMKGASPFDSFTETRLSFGGLVPRQPRLVSMSFRPPVHVTGSPVGRPRHTQARLGWLREATQIS